MRVFERVVEGQGNAVAVAGIEGVISCRLLVSKSQGGAVIGKDTGCKIKVLAVETISSGSLLMDQVVETTGEFANVQDALYRVTSRLRDNIFSVPMLAGNGNRNTLRAENAAYGRARDHPPFGTHVTMGNSDDLNGYKYLTQSMDHLAIPGNKEQLPLPSVFKSVMGSWVDHGNNMATFGKLLSVKDGVELGRWAMVMSMNGLHEFIRWKQMCKYNCRDCCPDAVTGSIYGENGANLERLRQISGAKVVVEEAARPGTTHTSVIISGTPDETQAAQSLLQAFILSGS